MRYSRTRMSPDGDTPEDVAYSPHVELWVMLPDGEDDACAGGRVRVYSVQGGWRVLEHRCVTDETGNEWAVVEVERLGAFALVIDDSPVTPTPTPAAAALAAPANSVIGNASTGTVRTSLPAQPPTPVPTVVPTVMPVPVAQAAAPVIVPTPTATAVTPTAQTAEPSTPVVQTSSGDGGSGGIGRIILAAIGVPMLVGALAVILLIHRERQRRNGHYTQ